MFNKKRASQFEDGQNEQRDRIHLFDLGLITGEPLKDPPTFGDFTTPVVNMMGTP